MVHNSFTVLKTFPLSAVRKLTKHHKITVGPTGQLQYLYYMYVDLLFCGDIGIVLHLSYAAGFLMVCKDRWFNKRRKLWENRGWTLRKEVVFFQQHSWFKDGEYAVNLTASL